MGRRRLVALLGTVLVGTSVLLTRAVAPARYDAAVGELDPLLGELPEPVVLAGLTLAVLAVWVAAMILLAKLLYRGWRQVDDYVFWAWDLVLPESPLIRFAVGLVLMLFVFVFGPLVVLQSVDFTADEEADVEETLDANTTTPANETATNESVAGSVTARLLTAPEVGSESSLAGPPGVSPLQERIRPT